MKSTLTVLVALLISTLAFGQTEDFEGETVGGTTFQTAGFDFDVTGDFLISQFTDFSCGATNPGTNTYLDTGFMDGASSGVVGSIVPNTPGVTFQVSTSTAQCGWTGQLDGNDNIDGTVRFTGTKTDDTTISEDFFLNTPVLDNELVPFTFTAGIWAGVDLKALQVELISPPAMNYFALDEFVFESISGPLPVELVSFSAVGHADEITLSWSTASEVNNARFEIERSTRGEAFKPIGEVEGMGTTSVKQDYVFVDSRPVIGVNSYRLKQVDLDGQFEYSHTISLSYFSEAQQVGAFYPNPSPSGLVHLDYFSSENEALTVSVFDLSGRLISSQVYPVTDGSNSLNLDYSAYAKGIYLVRLGYGVHATHRKLVIR